MCALPTMSGEAPSDLGKEDSSNPNEASQLATCCPDEQGRRKYINTTGVGKSKLLTPPEVGSPAKVLFPLQRASLKDDV